MTQDEEIDAVIDATQSALSAADWQGLDALCERTPALPLHVSLTVLVQTSLVRDKLTTRRGLFERVKATNPDPRAIKGLE